MSTKQKRRNLKQADYLKMLEAIYAKVPFGDGTQYRRFMGALGYFIHDHNLQVVEAANEAAAKEE